MLLSKAIEELTQAESLGVGRMDGPQSTPVTNGTTKSPPASSPISPKDAARAARKPEPASDVTANGSTRQSSRLRSSPRADDMDTAATNNSGGAGESKPVTVTPRVSLRRSPTNGSDKQVALPQEEQDEIKSGAVRQSTRTRTPRQTYNEQPASTSPKVGFRTRAMSTYFRGQGSPNRQCSFQFLNPPFGDRCIPCPMIRREYASVPLYLHSLIQNALHRRTAPN